MPRNGDSGSDRPFEIEPAPELSRAYEVPEWKKADFTDNWGNWETENPYSSTGFDFVSVAPEDWW